MADNLTLPPAAGKVLALKDIGGILFGLNLLADSAGGDAMGLVTANPAAFSLLGRLKAIADGLQQPKPGVGELAMVPAGSANGALVGAKPPAARGLRFLLPPGASVTFTVAAAAPGAVPTTFTVSATDTGPNWDEPLADGVNVYVTAKTGTPLFRYL